MLITFFQRSLIKYNNWSGVKISSSEFKAQDYVVHFKLWFFFCIRWKIFLKTKNYCSLLIHFWKLCYIKIAYNLSDVSLGQLRWLRRYFKQNSMSYLDRNLKAFWKRPFMEAVKSLVKPWPLYACSLAYIFYFLKFSIGFKF